MTGMRGILFDLLTERGDVLIERAGRALIANPPDPFEQIGSIENFALVREELAEKCEFTSRYRYRLAGAGQFERLRLNDHPAEAKG